MSSSATIYLLFSSLCCDSLDSCGPLYVYICLAEHCVLQHSVGVSNKVSRDRSQSKEFEPWLSISHPLSDLSSAIYVQELDELVTTPLTSNPTRSFMKVLNENLGGEGGSKPPRDVPGARYVRRNDSQMLLYVPSCTPFLGPEAQPQVDVEQQSFVDHIMDEPEGGQSIRDRKVCSKACGSPEAKGCRSEGALQQAHDCTTIAANEWHPQ